MCSFRRFIGALLAVVFCVICGLWIKSTHLVRFAEIEGERTYFLDSASSQGLRKTQLSVWDITRVKGECVQTSISTYLGGRYAMKKEIAEEIATKYGAKILFSEEVNGVTSYYAYTSTWTGGIFIYGQKINLHIAIGTERLTVGSPIIFDGY